MKRRNLFLCFSVLLLTAALAGCIGSFVYHPSREIAATPADAGLPYESVAFTAQDGTRLSGWWVPAPSGGGKEKVLLFCHGNAGNISHRLDSLVIFHRLGLSVFIFDYRGFGRSEGTPTEAGTYLDAQAARDYLVKQRRIAPDRIVVFGRSLGGAIAARLARLPCRALIIESAFISFREVARDHAPWVPGFVLSGYLYPTEEFLRHCAVPVLVIHSPQDEVVPYRHGRQLFRVAPEPKSYLEIHGSHNRGFLDSLPIYTTGLKKFLVSLK